jgi:hypothetical protein
LQISFDIGRKRSFPVRPAPGRGDPCRLRRCLIGVLGLLVFLVLFAYFALAPIVVAQTARAVAEKNSIAR